MSKKSLIITIAIASILCVLFCVVSVLVVVNGKNPFPIDEQIANWAYDTRGEKNGFTFWFFRIVTELGYTYFAVGLILVIAICLKFKPKAFFIGIPVAIAWALHEIVKLIIKRPRPDFHMWWMTESSTSFPSGHTNTATCLFILIIYFVLTSPIIKTWLKYLITSLSCIVIILVPLSRIIMGVHWFTDIVGGLLFGAFFACVSIIIYQIIALKKQNQIQKEIDTAKQKTGVS